MGARTETQATRMTGTGTMPSLPYCLPMQTYPHAFLLGLLQKKCILTNQRCVQRAVWIPEVIEGPLNDVWGPGLVFGAGRLRTRACALRTHPWAAPPA